MALGIIRPTTWSPTVASTFEDLLRGSIYKWTPKFAPLWQYFAIWPPNVFALTSELLGASGAYRLAVAPPVKWPDRGWNKRIDAGAERWRRESTRPRFRLPARVEELGRIIKGAFDTAIHDLPDDWRACAALLELHAMADAASYGLGLGLPLVRGEARHRSDGFEIIGNQLLQAKHHGSVALLCPRVVRVLPKLRTCQSGITLRSLSLQLAAHRGDVEVEWRQVPNDIPFSKRRLRILVLPWPERIDPTAFVPVKGPLENLDRSRFGFFAFRPAEPLNLAKLTTALLSAQKRCGRVHGVVLPEGAVAEPEIDPLLEILARHNVAFAIAGIRAPRRNYALLAVRNATGQGWRQWEQPKHHRWFLDDTQIRNYHLGSALHPDRKWWESIGVPPRKLTFFTANSWLTISHLICEDLARQDPVAQLVRAVGPNLVVALLMDGPQLRERWSARYAGVLADDPGSSVLSVTSIGMASRSWSDKFRPSRAVALWHDARHGSRQIELDAGSAGVVLTLSAEWVEEWAADGRTDGKNASQLVLTGVEQIPGGSQS